MISVFISEYDVATLCDCEHARVQYMLVKRLKVAGGPVTEYIDDKGVRRLKLDRGNAVIMSHPYKAGFILEWNDE